MSSTRTQCSDGPGHYRNGEGEETDEQVPACAVAAAITVLTLAGCYQKSALEGSQVEVVKVEGRRFEARDADRHAE